MKLKIAEMYRQQADAEDARGKPAAAAMWRRAADRIERDYEANKKAGQGPKLKVKKGPARTARTREIEQAIGSGRSHSEIAREFGTSRQHIHQVARRQNENPAKVD